MARIRSHTEIAEELVSDFLSYLGGTESAVTYIDPRSNVYGLFSATAKGLQRVEYEIDRNQRDLDIFTAEGDALDVIGAARGVLRFGPSSSGVVLSVYNSTTGVAQKLAAGSVVKSTGGVRFIVLDSTDSFQDVVLSDQSLMTQVQAISERPGASSNVPVYTVTTVDSYGAGSVGTPKIVNLMPSAGGEDRESDDAYRERIIRWVSLLNNRTRDKYLSYLQMINPSVLRALISAGNGPNAVTVWVVNRATGGSGFTTAQLTDMRVSLVPFVFPDDPTIANAPFQDFQIELTAVLDRNIDISTIYTSMLSKLAKYLNLATWPFGQAVRDDILLSLCAQTTGVFDVDRSNFLLKDGGTVIEGNVSVRTNQLPRLTRLTLNESGTSRTYGGAIPVTQTYTTYPNINRPLEA